MYIVVVVVPSGRKRPLVIPLDFLSKRYRVLLSLSCFRFVVSYFPRPCRSCPSIAFCFAWHLWCHASSSSWFFVFRLSYIYIYTHIYMNDDLVNRKCAKLILFRSVSELYFICTESSAQVLNKMCHLKLKWKLTYGLHICVVFHVPYVFVTCMKWKVSVEKVLFVDTEILLKCQNYMSYNIYVHSRRVGDCTARITRAEKV
jgi:hypothetical protein